MAGLIFPDHMAFFARTLAALLVLTWVSAGPLFAQALAPASTPASATKKPQSPTAGPTWQQLSPAQRRALAPLSSGWNAISEPQKSKWLALSQNFAKLSEVEQAKLHDRMTEWTVLSPQQRTRARLNFAETKDLTPEEKEARWQAYQALSSDEKKSLARAASPSLRGAAAAVKPVPAYKLATTPARPPASAPDADVTTPIRPRVLLGTSQLNKNTLLPKPAASAPQRP